MLTTERKTELCVQCQKCCRVLAFPTRYSIYDSFARQLYETRGWNTKIAKGVLWIYKEDPCPHLTAEGCDIYESRPSACKMYDGRDDVIIREDCLWLKENINGNKS